MAFPTLHTSLARTDTGRPSTDPEGPDTAVTPTAASGRPSRALSLIALLFGTGVLYLWGLSTSGYANSFYSAAAQAGSQSWKAFFFGSLDASNSITVDKPPASLWLMALSVRVFGLSSWSVLAPQALLGVATTAITYGTVRRPAGHWAGLAAGLILALTPAATLMFRFNNPDALLVFLLTLAAYFTLRATERASGFWLAGAGALIGVGFLTKMLQAFLVLPAFALVYLIAAPAPLRRRILHLVAAFSAMIISLGWWVAAVELMPVSWRPYIGGSQTNSVLELIFGYNGLGRITGNQVGSVTGGGQGGAQWGQTGIARLFDWVSGGMISWLIPAAVILTVVALVVLVRRPRTGSLRAAIIVFSAMLAVTGGVFSFMAGIYHDYYTVALAPAIAATVALSGTALWRARAGWPARIGLAVAMTVTTAWAIMLLGSAPQPYSSLRWVVVILGLLATGGLLAASVLRRIFARTVLAIALLAGILGPASYSVNTAATPHQGSIVTAGPVSQGLGGRGPGGQRQGEPGSLNRQPPPGQPSRPGGTTGGRGLGGGKGGLLAGTQVSSEMLSLLSNNGRSYTWAAATTGSQTAASYQLATRLPVMAIGGFNGTDPSPTLAEFKTLVSEGRIHYYIDGGDRDGQPNGGSNAATQIAAWVSETFPASTVDGTTVYDLTQGN